MMGKMFSPRLKVLLIVGLFLLAMVPMNASATKPIDITGVWVKSTSGTIVSHRGTVHNPLVDGKYNNMVKGDQWVVATSVTFASPRPSHVCVNVKIQDNNGVSQGDQVSYWTQYQIKPVIQDHMTIWVYNEPMFRDFSGFYRAMGEGQWEVEAVYVGETDTNGGCNDRFEQYIDRDIVSGQAEDYEIADAYFEVHDTNDNYDRTVFVLMMQDESLTNAQLDSALELSNNDFLEHFNIRFMHKYASINWIYESFVQSRSTCGDGTGSELLSRAINESPRLLGREWEPFFATARDSYNDLNPDGYKSLYYNYGYDILFGIHNYGASTDCPWGVAWDDENGGNIAIAGDGSKYVFPPSHSLEQVTKHELSHLFGAVHHNGWSIMNSGLLTSVWNTRDFDEMGDWKSVWNTPYDLH